MWRFKARISANKNPRNLLRCIKISLDQRLRSTKEIYRFTRLVFGFTQSPFVLDATVQHHLQNYINKLEELVKQIRCTNSKRRRHTNIQRRRVCLTKVALKFPWARINNPEQSSTEQTYAKQQLGVKSDETKMLGIKWDKKKDKLNIEIPPPIQKITKRNIYYRNLPQFLMSWGLYLHAH